MDTKNAPDQPAVATEPAEMPAAQNLTMDVVVAPATVEETYKADNGEATASTKDAPKPDAKSKVEKPPKTPGDNGVTVAITVAVVAILLLSGLAVFAYMSGTKH